MGARLTARDHILRSESESSFQARVIAFAQLHGWRAAHFRTVKVQRKDGTTRYLTPVQADGAGFPDLILVRGERIIAAELKSELGKGPTVEQWEWLAAFAMGGIETECWRPRDWDTLEAMLR